MQLKNVMLAVGTFLVGIAFAALFSPGPARPITDADVSFERRRPETCIHEHHLGSGRHLFHTERGRILHDQIRKTAIELGYVISRIGMAKPGDKPQLRAQQRQLELRLQWLVTQREQLLGQENREHEDEVATTKLIFRESCYQK